MAPNPWLTVPVAPHTKALFQGFDVTMFAYGVTGTGKTHTMRGGLKLAERGVIPRLLSNVFRRGKKIMKDSEGETTVAVALSYYEIYNDKVFDLLEPPEKRTPSGLPLRDNHGKTVVVGLSERSCGDLKDFERLYIEANTNRVTAATKLNAHSSRSHAILRVKVTQTTGDRVLESTASAIDLAGSEDNRRTDNDKERLVESAAINKSLFVLSQCIDAISRGDKRIPYRESKMTRILSLGQNNGITIMILNLAPMRSYHLDTLSSLNVSSRAKRIEVREIENEVVFKQAPRSTSGSGGRTRQPLRPLANAHNVATGAAVATKEAAEKDKDSKPVKAFSVYTDRVKPVGARTVAVAAANSSQLRRSSSNKRPSDPDAASTRPSKLARPAHQVLQPRPSQTAQAPSISAAQIEAMVEKKVSEILASRAAAAAAVEAVVQPHPVPQDEPSSHAQHHITEEVERRLGALERRIESTEQDDGRSAGLRILLHARQAKERGDDETALHLYEKALPFFPGQAKLLGKIEKLRAKLPTHKASGVSSHHDLGLAPVEDTLKRDGWRQGRTDCEDDYGYQGGEADIDDESFVESRSRVKVTKKQKASKPRSPIFSAVECEGSASPRTKQLLDIVNSRDLSMIRGLHGFGAKKAQELIDNLESPVASLVELRMIPGIGGRAIERAYEGLLA